MVLMTFDEDWADVQRSDEEAQPLRRVRLTRAADIAIRPVHWLWADRVALGTLALLGGREGIGKSTVAYQLASDITRGRLPGVSYGRPRAVIVAASEDSWGHTIVPRLMAADADLSLIYRVDVTTYIGHETGLSLPRDLMALQDAVVELKAALILLDPLMSRLDSKLDTHKDAEVRQALEPLVHIADNTGASILGLVHVNKGMSSDPLTMLMGSRAFAAVARAVLFCMVDPDDEAARIMGQPKNNLGRTDLPTLAFKIVSAHVADTDDGPIFTGRVDWQDETPRSLGDVIDAASAGAEVRTATQEAAEWLTDWLASVGGTDESAVIKREGAKAGHSQDALKRARHRVGAVANSEGFPRRTFWTLPDSAPVGAPSGGSCMTALTTPTAPTDDQSAQWERSVQSGSTPQSGAPTGGAS